VLADLPRPLIFGPTAQTAKLSFCTARRRGDYDVRVPNLRLRPKTNLSSFRRIAIGTAPEAKR